MKTALKNTTSYGGKLLKMNEDVYSMRRKVIDVIYEVKSKGFSIPRVEVRIVSKGTQACAYAYLGCNIVHFSEKYINDSLFTQAVLHEVVHAVFGVGEVEGCKLMHCSEFWNNKPTIDEAWTLFDKYYKQWKQG